MPSFGYVLPDTETLSGFWGEQDHVGGCTWLWGEGVYSNELV